MHRGYKLTLVCPVSDQQQSRAVGDTLERAPELRNQMIREHGEAGFWERYEPLNAEP